MTTKETHADDAALDRAVYIALLVLTGLTLGASHIKEGRAVAVTVALAIASAKAALIGFYFMDLRRERLFMHLILGIAMLAVLILAIGLLPDLTFFRG